MDYHFGYSHDCRIKKRLHRNRCVLRKPVATKKSGSRQDPLLVLTYFVLIGVLISSFTSFGL